MASSRLGTCKHRACPMSGHPRTRHETVMAWPPAVWHAGQVVDTADVVSESSSGDGRRSPYPSCYGEPVQQQFYL